MRIFPVVCARANAAHPVRRILSIKIVLENRFALFSKSILKAHPFRHPKRSIRRGASNFRKPAFSSISSIRRPVSDTITESERDNIIQCVNSINNMQFSPRAKHGYSLECVTPNSVEDHAPGALAFALRSPAPYSTLSFICFPTVSWVRPSRGIGDACARAGSSPLDALAVVKLSHRKTFLPEAVVTETHPPRDELASHPLTPRTDLHASQHRFTRYTTFQESAASEAPRNLSRAPPSRRSCTISLKH